MRLTVARMLTEARTSLPSPSHTMGLSEGLREARGETRARDNNLECRSEERVGACLDIESSHSI